VVWGENLGLEGIATFPCPIKNYTPTERKKGDAMHRGLCQKILRVWEVTSTTGSFVFIKLSGNSSLFLYKMFLNIRIQCMPTLKNIIVEVVTTSATWKIKSRRTFIHKQ